MKKSAVILFIILFISSCSASNNPLNNTEKTNERFEIKFYSAGKLIKKYKRARILYSSEGANSILVATEDGKRVFLRGDIILDLQ